MKKELVVLLTVILILTSQRLFAQSWTTPENVTNNVGIFDQKPSLDIGPAPFLAGEAAHIAYNRVDAKEIWYALKEFGRQPPAWNFFQATNRQTTNAPNTENWKASLMATSTGRVYIAYQGEVAASDKEIFIVNNVNGTFNFLPAFVTANNADDDAPSLFVHGTSPHAAYVGPGGIDPSNQDEEIWYDDFTTKSQLTLNGSNDDEAPSLVIDGNGKAHVAFASIGGAGATGDKEIWYAENTTGQWLVTQVSVNGFEDTNPSIRIEASGAVHIAWHGLTESFWDIYYTNNISAPFPNANIRVTADAANEKNPSLVVDPFSQAHIAYEWTVGDPPTEQIYYTHNMGGVFTSQAGTQEKASTTQSTNNIFPSMDIDSNNHLHLAYQGFDGVDTEVYYTVTGGAVPVELVTFEAAYDGKGVFLRWLTATESNNFGFEIQRSRDGKNFNKIAFVTGQGTTAAPQSYSFVDRNIRTGRYFYRLKQIDFDGSFSYSDVLEVSVAPPSTFELHQNFPNPFNPATEISYAISTQEMVTLDIYNLRGELVINLARKVHEAGNYLVRWNGQNQHGDETASGVYLVRLKTEKATKVIKMVKVQ